MIFCFSTPFSSLTLFCSFPLEFRGTDRHHLCLSTGSGRGRAERGGTSSRNGCRLCQSIHQTRPRGQTSRRRFLVRFSLSPITSNPSLTDPIPYICSSHSRIVIAPGYFSFVMGKDRQAIHDFFTEVADKSPLPVVVYNFPGAAAGIDLDSDAIIALSEHPNIIGVKLTCAGIAKGRVVSPLYVHLFFLKRRISRKPV